MAKSKDGKRLGTKSWRIFLEELKKINIFIGTKNIFNPLYNTLAVLK